MPHETRHDKTRQDKTRRNKTRRSKTGQNKTKQNEIRQNLAELDWAESDQTRQKMERKTHTYTHKKKNKRAARIILGDFFSAQDRMRSTKQHLVNAAWSPELTHALWCSLTLWIACMLNVFWLKHSGHLFLRCCTSESQALLVFCDACLKC